MHPRQVLVISKSLGVGLLATCLLNACLALSLPAQEFRNWQDNSGRFSLEAQLVEKNERDVVLLSRDGRTITVPIERLSEADRNFLETSTAAKFDGELPAVMGTTPNWQFQIDASGRESRPDVPKVIALPDRKTVTETFAITAINQRARRAVISSVWSDRRNGRKQMTRLQLLDLDQGELVFEASLEGAWKPLTLDDQGERLLLTNNPKSREANEGRLVVARRVGDAIEFESEWKPYEDISDPTDDELLAELQERAEQLSKSEKSQLDSALRARTDHSRWSALKRFRPPAGKPIRFGEFVGEDQLVTVNPRGMIRFWNVGDPEHFKELEFPGGGAVQLSPDRRHMALANGTSVAVVDLANPGSYAMKSFAGRPGAARLAFSPSGKRLVVSPSNLVFLWDVASGELLHGGSLHFAGANRAVAMPTEDILLIDNAYLYDFESQTFPWIFDKATCQMAGSTALWMPENKPAFIVMDKLPGRDVMDQLESFVGAAEFQIIQPGFEVAIDVADVPPKYQKTVTKGLENAIKNVGGKVVSNSEVVVQGFINAPEERRVAYMFTGTHDVPVIVSGVRILVDGDVRWQQAWDNLPQAVERGSHAETTARLRKICENPELGRYNYDQLLPSKLQRTPDGPRVTEKFNAFGRSSLTREGWQAQ